MQMSGRERATQRYARDSPRVRLNATLFALLACLAGTAEQGAAKQSTIDPSVGKPEAHLGAGYENLRNNRYESAAHEFQAALALDPTLVLQARFPLAVALFELHRTAEARNEFEAVRRESGDHPNVDYYLGRIDLDKGRVDSAILELSKAAVKPPFPDTAYYLGYAYLKRHDLAPAETWLRRAAELAPRDSGVQYRLGMLYTEAGRRQEAQQALLRSEQLRRRESEADRVRVDCTEKLERGALSEARPVCDQLFDSDDAEKLTMLGTLYGQHGDFAEALRPLRRAAELSPNSPEMQYNLAFDYFQLHQYREARDPLIGAVERWPDLYPLNALLGAVLRNLGEERQAFAALRHAHELDPQDPGTAASLYEVALSLGRKTLADRQYSTSIEYVSEAARLRPLEREPHRLLAELYAATGRRAEAAEERRQFERFDPSGGAKKN